MGWNPIAGYTHWLHTMYPTGTVERLPAVREDGSTRIPNVYIVGDLKGIPLLKFSTDSGARVIETIADSESFQAARRKDPNGEKPDVVIIGAGVAGISAALRAKRKGLTYRVLEASNTFSTIINFPKGKPIYTYPRDFEPDSDLATTGDVKESLLEELAEQVREAGITVEEGVAVDKVTRQGGGPAVVLKDGTRVETHAVVIAIGRSGNYRKLGVPGEELDKVMNRLHDPKDYATSRVLVVGGGDSALETAIAIAEAGGEVTLSYRKPEFARPKPDNVEKITALAEGTNGTAAPGRVRLLMDTSVRRIDDMEVTIANNKTKAEETIPNDHVFALIGREAPLDFFRKSGLPINGEWNITSALLFVLFFLFCTWLYDWKSGGYFDVLFQENNWFPYNIWPILAEWSSDRTTVIGTIANSMYGSSFYYTLAYSALVVGFGIARIRRRKTPYITVQTSVLMAIQVIPLFILPEIVLPYLGANGWFDSGFLNTMANGLFPGEGADREWWRAYGLILAWPLFIYNFFTAEPLWWWLALGSIQTFLIIPGLIYFFGKGSYCGWICSCGALAETLGDTHRHKMPHGKFWSKLNMTGQVILWIAVLLMGARIYAWNAPDSAVAGWFDTIVSGKMTPLNLVLTDPSYYPDEQIQWNEVTQDDGSSYWEVAAVTDPQGNPVPEDEYHFDRDGYPVTGEETWVAWKQDAEGNWQAIARATGEPVQGDFVEAYTAGFQPVEQFRINYLSYKWLVDVLLAGIVGYGFYFWYSGRVWCRFACPLAALMHLYAKFSTFRILADKKKCISCNVCTSVCHQGIDVMNFANKGVPMEDPECVRCSACVQSCPTGVLEFGRVDREGNVIGRDWLAASPVQMREGKN